MIATVSLASSGLKSSGVVSILADDGKPYSSPSPGSQRPAATEEEV
jgi:hypothetical protein